MYPNAAGQKGVTLIEMVITIIVLGIALAAVVGSIARMTERSADPLIQNKTVALAQTYIDEILSKRYEEASPIGGGSVPPPATLCAALGPEAGESRADYDDVDDYNGFGPVPTDQTDTNFPNYENYTVAIAVVCHGEQFSLGTNMAKRIDVSITPPGWNAPMVFSVYRGYF